MADDEEKLTAVRLEAGERRLSAAAVCAGCGQARLVDPCRVCAARAHDASWVLPQDGQ